ncbi:MAG: dicarboxylate/amino acid:cation symporter [Firmicutes bacterium]|jgi:Na+/H+-dicarboxylate symporter|nr:dicarboxylate/amino acid:cation symporter [Bacillota bacterium]
MSSVYEQPPSKKFYLRPLKHLASHLGDLLRRELWLKILLGLFLGLGVGIALSPHANLVSPDTAAVIGKWLALPGNIFLGLIQMIVVPLVVASIIRGMAAIEDLEQLRRLGLRVIAYFITTTILAVMIGIGVTAIIQPGKLIEQPAGTAIEETIPPTAGEAFPEALNLETIPDIAINLLPQNPLAAMVEREMLPVIIFAVLIGLALVTLAPRQAKPLLDLLGSLHEVCMTVVRWAMRLAPLAVFGLLAQITIKVGLEALLGMAAYVGTVLLGLLLMLCVYLLIVCLVSRKNPLAFLKAVREAQLLAFSTSSSAAVLPLSIQTATERLKVRPSFSEFVIPLGATINMDGTAIYQAASTVFLAQVFGTDLGLTALIIIVLTTTAASIGAPATPGMGIVILTMVLKSVGIPPAGIALILGVERILDMSRTVINVTGDMTAALVMEHWAGSSERSSKQLTGGASPR